MKIKTKIRLFLIENGKFLLKLIGIIAVVVFIIQVLNQRAKVELAEKEIKLGQEKKMQEINLKIKNKDKEDKNFISQFIDYCNNGDIENAYNMLSQSCKEDKFATVEVFKTNYIKNNFKFKQEYEIIKEKDGYQILLLKDTLQSGKLENREQITEYYKIIEDVLGTKRLYINSYNGE